MIVFDKNVRVTPFIVQFVPDQIFVVVEKTLYKIRDTGDIGNHMFIEGFLMGRQIFSSKITCIEYVDGYTLIGFIDGRVVKIIGTGGTGQNMFNIKKSPNGFVQCLTNYQNYLSGSHRFRNGVVEIFHNNGFTLFCFGKVGKDKILKVKGAAGTGHNFCAIRETSTSFSGLQGYNYFVGYQKMDARVTDITKSFGWIFISFQDGRQIKLVGNMGGTGGNMFAITKTNYGFKSVQGYFYLAGSMRYSKKSKSYVIKGLEVKGGTPEKDVTFFSLRDGRIMKIKGDGGTGANMFNITETGYGFRTYSTNYNPYLIGSHKFSSGVSVSGEYVIDMDYIDENLIVCIKDHHVLKINKVGGTGGNMFNVKIDNDDNYVTATTSSAPYLDGSQTLDDFEITQLVRVLEGAIPKLFLSLLGSGATAEQTLKFENMGRITNTQADFRNMLEIIIGSFDVIEASSNVSPYLGREIY